MAYSVVWVKKEPVDNSTTLCCWHYRASRDDGQKFRKDEVWGLDLPGGYGGPGANVQDAQNYAECNKYRRGWIVARTQGTPPSPPIIIHKKDPERLPDDLFLRLPDRWVVNVTLDADADVFEISFIAPCDESGGRTPVSLHRWVNEKWENVEFKGDSKMNGPKLASAREDREESQIPA